MIDAHCHLQTLLENNLDDILNEANNHRITQILNIYEYKDRFLIDNVKSIISNIKILNGVGIHPCEVSDISKEDAWNWLESHNDWINVYGETGLDLYKANNKIEQLDYYDMHVKLCEKYKKPAVIHCRNCDSSELIKLTSVTNMWHSFSFDVTEAKKVLDLNNSFLSFSGMVTFKSAKSIVESLIYCPLDRLLVETDCPFLTPEPLRGKQNRPHFIYHTYKFIAEIKNIPMEKLIDQVNKNFYEFLNNN
jgi:TatD DNase family protein